MFDVEVEGGNADQWRQSNTIFTCGEDGCVKAWKTPTDTPMEITEEKESSSSKKERKKSKKGKNEKRYKPY